MNANRKTRRYVVARMDGSREEARFAIPTQEKHLDGRDETEKVNSGEYIEPFDLNAMWTPESIAARSRHDKPYTESKFVIK